MPTKVLCGALTILTLGLLLALSFPFWGPAQ